MAKRHADTETETASIKTGVPTQPEINSQANDETIERIRSRAYEIWEAEGGLHGRQDEHWLQAEHEILHGNDLLESDDVPNLVALREAAHQHTDTFIVATDLEDADQRDAMPGVREQP